VSGEGSREPRSKLAPALPVPHALRDYALLADGERGALVGPRGDLCWLCFPGWDSEALFASLIGGGGAFVVAPVGRFVWGGFYEQPGLIWRSRWICDDGSVIECREALALPASSSRAVVLRRLTAAQGAARVRVLLDLRASFGRKPARGLRREEDGSWSARVGSAYARLCGGEDAEVVGLDEPALAFEIELAPGAQHDLLLALDTARDPELPDPEQAWQGTEARWHELVPTLEHTIAPRDARHAYAVMQGLTCSSGGMVAAATTSLPERAEQGRNYDYRYVWIRDQCYAGQALARAGELPLLDEAVRFVSARLLEHGPHLRPAYTTMGGPVPDERRLRLPGYPGGYDVIGNRVADQFQLDAFGEALLLLATAAERDRLDADGWRAAELAAEAIERRWRERDAGVWELEEDAWTHSRLICAAGLRALGACQRSGARIAKWLALAEQITAETSAASLHPSGRWQRSPSDERLDAALLWLPLRGAIAPADPRTIATLRAIERELTDDGFCYRYRPDQRPLGEAEGAFLLCGFLMALAHQQQGDGLAAARWFERNRTACGPPGLLSEEFDVTQRQLRGNIPQAFVHALVLECAAALAEEPCSR